VQLYWSYVRHISTIFVKYHLVVRPLASRSVEEVGDGIALSDELVGGLLHAGLGDLVIEVESHDGGVLAAGGGAGEGEHEACGDSVEFSVGLEGNGLPLIGSLNPVAHVVDGSVSSGGSGRKFTEFDDLGSALLHAGSELVGDPAGVNERLGGGTGDGSVADVGVHGG